MIVFLLLIPVLLFALSQKQEIRKRAETNLPVDFPQVDLNGDGVINNVDLRIYLENSSSSPKP